MAPRSVAVIGASPRVGTTGNRTVQYLVDFGFAGPIYPIHPNADLICGFRAYQSLADVPAIPDCVAVAIPAEKVIAALEDAARLGVRGAVVFASGFGESDPEGKARQRELEDLCRRTGLLVCGPNCLGIANIPQRISLYSSLLPAHIQPGGLGVVSHSGSSCILLSNLKRFGFSTIIAAGNGAIIDIADYLDFLAEDESTRVAALFIETIREPEKFAAAARKMYRAGKAVIALKVGHSEKGAAATAAHTGSLAGSEEVYQSFFERAGVIVVDDLDELVESAALMLATGRLPRGKGLGVINVSGGEIALTCDIARRVGLELPELSSATESRLREILPSFGHATNPLDATGAAVFDVEIYRRCIEALAADPRLDLIAVSQDCPADLAEPQAERYGKLAAAAAEVAKKLEKPLVFYSNLAAGIHPRIAEPLLKANVPLLQGARASLLAIKRLFDRHAPQECMEESNKPQLDATWRERLATGATFSEREAKEFLAAHGIATNREFLARTSDEAATAACQLSFPVVLKIQSQDIAHKTEVGGVRLGLRTVEDVATAFAEITDNVKRQAPEARVDGIAVQEMIVGGTEIIVGLTRQDPFGMALTIGAGGVMVELLRDSALALLPLDRSSAFDLIGRTRIAALLRGYRGGKPADMGAVVDLLLAMSRIGSAYGGMIEVFELNPVSVLPVGSGVRILDALLIPRSPGHAQATMTAEALTTR
ncbi:MAG: acetate--CoA ligase family protein [Pseudorhodoplanes sp.]